MNNIEQIKARLAKLMALSERGVGGERDTAERLLHELADRHGISLDDIGSDVEHEYVVKIRHPWQRTIFIQLLGLMRIEQYGDRHAAKLSLYKRKVRSGSRSRRKIVDQFFTVCTDAQWLELEAKYVVLCADYDRQIKAFPLAFLIRNNLLMPYNPDAKAPTAKEDEEYLTAETLACGISKSSLNKQLEMMD